MGDGGDDALSDDLGRVDRARGGVYGGGVAARGAQTRLGERAAAVATSASGPSYWEAAKLLWAAARVRREGDVAPRPVGTDALVAVCDDLERLWSARRTKPTSVNTADLAIGLPLTFPYWNSILVFEPLDPAPADEEEEVTATLLRSRQRLVALEASLQTRRLEGLATQYASTAASRRVGVLRAALALSAWMAETAEPILRMHWQIRDLLATPTGLSEGGLPVEQRHPRAAAEIGHLTIARNVRVRTVGMESFDESASSAAYGAADGRAELARAIAGQFGALEPSVRAWFGSGEGFRTGVRLAFHRKLAEELAGFVTLREGQVVLSTAALRREGGVEVPVLARSALWYEDLRIYAQNFWPLVLASAGSESRVREWIGVTFIGEGVGTYFEQLKQKVLDIDSFMRMALPLEAPDLANAPFEQDQENVSDRTARFARA